MIPIHLQMQIDLMAADAKRAITEGFAAARAKLLPEPAPDPLRAWMLAQQQSLAADPRGLNWTHCYNNAAALQNRVVDPWRAFDHTGFFERYQQDWWDDYNRAQRLF